MAGIVVDAMKYHGTKFLEKCLPKSVNRQDGRLVVEYESISDGRTYTEIYDTVMTAIGK